MVGVIAASDATADSTRALKTRVLRRLTKRVATPTEIFSEEIQGGSNMTGTNSDLFTHK
jgi:hypothetical protein